MKSDRSTGRLPLLLPSMAKRKKFRHAPCKNRCNYGLCLGLGSKIGVGACTFDYFFFFCGAIFQCIGVECGVAERFYSSAMSTRRERVTELRRGFPSKGSQQAGADERNFIHSLGVPRASTEPLQAHRCNQVVSRGPAYDPCSAYSSGAPSHRVWRW